MKKILFLLTAFLLSVNVTSCKSDSAQGSTDAAQTQETPENVEQPAQPLNLADIVAQAKADGANWSVDQWKDAFKKVLITIKPKVLKLTELQKKSEENPDSVAMILSDLNALMKEFEPLEKQMDEFVAAAEASENGKKVIDDDAWAKQVFRELCFPEDFSM